MQVGFGVRVFFKEVHIEYHRITWRRFSVIDPSNQGWLQLHMSRPFCKCVVPWKKGGEARPVDNKRRGRWNYFVHLLVCVRGGLSISTGYLVLHWYATIRWLLLSSLDTHCCFFWQDLSNIPGSLGGTEVWKCSNYNMCTKKNLRFSAQHLMWWHPSIKVLYPTLFHDCCVGSPLLSSARWA